MYLTSTELLKIKDTVIQGCEHPNHPFQPDTQIRACSIDIRVDHIFWKTKKRGFNTKLDLGRTRIYSVSPHRLWKKITLNEGEAIPLKPGEMLLGRTYEKICLPDTLVGKINTRSSFARLGISTACNCDLVNPGYAGHVPLELTNTTPNTIWIHPYMSLCQIFLMRLDGEVKDSYSSKKYESKYMDDDGGPSRWWRDDLVVKISKYCINSKMSDNVIDQLHEKFKIIPTEDDAALDRLEKFIDNTKIPNADELVSKFCQSEKVKYNIYRTIKALSYLVCGGTFISILTTEGQKFLDHQQNFTSYIVTVIFFTSIIPCTYYFFSDERKYYTSLNNQK